MNRWLVFGLTLLSTLAAIGFVLSPVEQRVTTFDWPHGPATDSALPLFPYRATDFTATLDCQALAAVPGGMVLGTEPRAGAAVLRPPGDGLAIESRGGAMLVKVAGKPMFTEPAGGRCAWRVIANAGGTSVLAGDTVVAHSDAVPVVRGFFTDAKGQAGGLHVVLTTDERFASSPSLLKIILGAVAALALLAALIVLRRGDTRRVRLLPRRGFHTADLAVLGGLLVWLIIGPLTVDDGYISTMINSAGDTGFTGNYFRWFNAPEAPFGWFYEPYRWWSSVSTAMPWLRLPAAIIGAASWLIIRSMVLPRVAARTSRWLTWAAAGTFLLWYLPFDLGLRPEPWLVLGTLLVYVLTERAVAARAVAPLGLAVLIAGATVAVTPTGLVAVLPLLAGLPAILRLLRHRAADVPWWVAVALLFAAGGGTLLLMFYDQTPATVVEATRVRNVIGPNLPLLSEPTRYQRLLDPTITEGALNRRVPVLITYACAAVLAVLLLRRRAPGLVAAPAGRLLVAAALMPVVLLLTPTKWTHHFGAFAGLGAVVIAMLVHTVARGALRTTLARAATVAAVACVLAVGLAAPNNWWAVSRLNVKWADATPGIAGVSFSKIVLAAGVLLALAGLAFWLRRRSAEAPRWLPSATGLLTVAVWAVVALEVLTMAYGVVIRRNTYSIGKASVMPQHCGIEDYLDVELDTSAGALRAGADGWYELPAGIDAHKTAPLVFPASGNGKPAVTIEFGKQNGGAVDVLKRITAEPNREGNWRDLRFDPSLQAPTADRVRINAQPHPAVTIGAPRIPVLSPLNQLVPAGERVAVDWPNAFLLPCRRPALLADGVTYPVNYRFAEAADMSGIAAGEFDQANGGPYAPLHALGTERQFPTYLRGDSVEEPVHIARFGYVAPPLAGVNTQHGTRTAPALETLPRIAVK